MQIINTTIWKVLYKSSLEKCNTMCLEQTFLISRMPMSTIHIFLSTAAMQQFRCREHLVLEALNLSCNDYMYAHIVL